MSRVVEILPYQSLGRDSFLPFRDQPIASFGMGTIKSCLESARRRRLSRLRLKRPKRDLRLADGGVISLDGDDLAEGVAHRNAIYLSSSHAARQLSLHSSAPHPPPCHFPPASPNILPPADLIKPPSRTA